MQDSWLVTGTVPKAQLAVLWMEGIKQAVQAGRMVGAMNPAS